MKKLELTYVGKDDWSRPVFKDQNGKLFKDINCGSGTLSLCTVYGGIDGEPDTPIEYIPKYENIEIELIGWEREVTEEERFNYQLLDRLLTDCEYYLGNGNKSSNHLWAKDERSQIEKMKELYNSFSEDKKPVWLTWEGILNYEKAMVGNHEI